uniref:Uncharacterized protein n=1 Tax=Avena sativa TaxID=4498 RepID=A0ACD5YF50_AVESA
MEYTTRGWSAAAVDDVGNGRRFPDPPPPHGRDTFSASADMAALVFRREQLLQELHRERIRHDMILCELAETERVMTACLAGRGASCGRPLMTPWEEAMYRTARSSDETSWWCRSPSSPAIAPVYPRVERSPSPVLQPRPVNNAEKQERGSSSRPVAVEHCPSLRKQLAGEEALVPAATNVVAKPAQPVLLSKEVTLECRGVVDHVHEAGLKDRHLVQLMQGGIQKSEQLKRPAVDQEHQVEAEDMHAVQLMDCEVQRSEQPTHAAVGHEYRAKANKDSQRSEQLQRAAIGQEHEVDTNVRREVQVTASKFEQVKHGLVDQEHEAEVKSHDVQLMESEIHRSEEPKCEAFGQKHEAEEKDRHAVQLAKISEDPNPAEPTIKDEWRQLPHQYALIGKDKSSPNDQKRLVFNEPNTQIMPSGVTGRQIFGPTVETPPPKRHKPREEWSCTQCQVSLSCEEDLKQHQAGELHRLALVLFQPRQEPSELTAKPTPESSYRAPQFLRRLVRPVLEKSEAPKEKPASRLDMRNHPKHTSHHENSQTLHTGKGWNHLRDRSYQESTHALHTEEGGGKEGSKWAADRTGTEDQRKKFVTKRRLPFCDLCKVQCNSEKMMESHLRGKKHQESTHALHTEEGGGKEGIKCAAADRTGTEGWRRFVTNRRFPFCELCKVQCDSEKTLESHLGGKKHLEKLEAHHTEMQLRLVVAGRGEVPC